VSIYTVFGTPSPIRVYTCSNNISLYLYNGYGLSETYEDTGALQHCFHIEFGQAISAEVPRLQVGIRDDGRVASHTRIDRLAQPVERKSLCSKKRTNDKGLGLTTAIC
jgi:hypothetical protein